MIEKALVVIMFMYASGFGILIAQYLFADVYGVTLTNFSGVPIKSNLLSALNVNQINTIESNVTSTSRSTVVSNINSFLSMAWELFLLLTGTYIFNILYLLGVPAIAISALVGLYVILCIRALIGYIRGI